MAFLVRGSRGNEVRRLQALICVAGIDAKPIDGVFGEGTRRAVRLCRRRFAIPESDLVDDDLHRAIGMDKPDTTKVLVPVIDRVTVEGVRAMFPAATPRQNVERHLPVILDALRHEAMDDRELVLMALATIRAETEAFVPIDERVSRFNTDEGAHPFNRYDDRASLGNRGAPDGERFRGRGFIQLTGRANYQRFGDRIGVDLIAAPERANEPELAARILAEFLGAQREAIKYAILGQDLVTARKLVNGGTHGGDRFAETFRKGTELLSA